MPPISFDGQGFAIGGRRLWVMGAAIESSLLPSDQWSHTLAILRQRGFNTVRTSAPWQLHEMRPGTARFDGSLDLRTFVSLCRDHGLWTVLRIGPVVGGTFSGGGLPAWLSEIEGLRPREPSEAFLQLVSRWYGAVLAQLKGLDATRRGDSGRGVDGAGGLLAVQIDHGWECGNTKVAERYLTELRRFVREAGVEVPVLTANGLWAGAEETIDVWQGSEDLFSHVRQLRHAQSHAPAIVEVASPASLRRKLAAPQRGGTGVRTQAVPALDGDACASRIGRTIAAGGQTIVAHAAPEVHRGAPAASDVNGALLANAVEPCLLAHRGGAGPLLGAIAPLAMFASNFGVAMAGESNGDAVVVDPDLPCDAVPIVVSRASSAGTIAFVFSAPLPSSAPRRAGAARGKRAPRVDAFRQVTLVSGDGMRLPVMLSAAAPPLAGESIDAPNATRVSWFPFDLDLHGRARLDYASLSPVAFVNKSLLVLFGPPGVRAIFSLDGSELRVETPTANAGAKPRVLLHAGIAVVICNEAQVSSLLIESDGVIVGADHIGGDGTVVRAAGFAEAVRIDVRGRVTVAASAPASSARAAPALASAAAARGTDRAARVQLKGWRRADATDFVAGTSDRFASIESPRSLAAFAPRTGRGWYRLRVPASRRETLLWLPGAVGDFSAWLEGKPHVSLGSGHRLPLRVPAGKGSDARSLVLLATDAGRPLTGLATSTASGIQGAAWEVAAVRAKIKSVATPPFDPFERRAFVPLAPGPVSERSVEITLKGERATPIVIDPGCAFYGAVIVNGRLVDVMDVPVGTVSGIVLGPGVPGWSTGVLAITLVPMRAAPTLERSVRVYRRLAEVDAARRGTTAWAFARWQIPERTDCAWQERDATRAPARPSARPTRGVPAWWSLRIAATDACVIDLSGLTRGAIFIDGEPMGRFDAQQDLRMPLPIGALKAGGELVIFDEQGAEPSRVALM